MLSATATFIALSQASYGHTRLEAPQINEGARVYNNEVIGHGCTDPATGSNTINTLGTVAVFPDGVDSSVTVNGIASSTPLTDIVSGWGIGKVQSKSIFPDEGVMKDANGNVTGYWTGGAPGLTAGLVGLIPFRTNAVSCAKSVQFVVAIADICAITDINSFNESNVKLWTPAVGSNFDGVGLDGYNSPATLTVVRTSALPASCGAGDVVVVTPSAAQLNRDFPVIINGSQYWPKP